MTSVFDHLRDADVDEDDYDEDEIDISDLQEKYEVQLEQGYDTFVVIDGLPKVDEEQKPKLVKFLLKKLAQVGKTREDLVYMPMGEDGKSLRCASRLDTRRSALTAETKTYSNKLVALPSWNIPQLPRPLPPSDS
jgi:hypothetical protein